MDADRAGRSRILTGTSYPQVSWCRPEKAVTLIVSAVSWVA